MLCVSKIRHSREGGNLDSFKGSGAPHARQLRELREAWCDGSSLDMGTVCRAPWVGITTIRCCIHQRAYISRRGAWHAPLVADVEMGRDCTGGVGNSQIVLKLCFCTAD